MNASCFFDGEIPGMNPLLRFCEHAETTAGSGQQINFSWTAPCNVQMEQFTVHWSALPTTTAEFKLTKDAVAGAQYTTVLRAIDPSVKALTNLVCIIPFRFNTGDKVKFEYTNPNNLAVGLEVMLVQVR